MSIYRTESGAVCWAGQCTTGRIDGNGIMVSVMYPGGYFNSDGRGALIGAWPLKIIYAIHCAVRGAPSVNNIAADYNRILNMDIDLLKQARAGTYTGRVLHVGGGVVLTDNAELMLDELEGAIDEFSRMPAA